MPGVTVFQNFCLCEGNKVFIFEVFLVMNRELGVAFKQIFFNCKDHID